MGVYYAFFGLAGLGRSHGESSLSTSEFLRDSGA